MSDDIYDPIRGVGVRSGRPPTEWQGPLRKAPAYYAGKKYKGKKFMHSHVEGTGKKNKAARRLIREARRKQQASTERAQSLPRAMQAQAREIVTERADGTPRTGSGASRAARRLFEKELAIHTPRPNEPTRAERRECQRWLKKHGKKDAIAQLVDEHTKDKP